MIQCLLLIDMSPSKCTGTCWQKRALAQVAIKYKCKECFIANAQSLQMFCRIILIRTATYNIQKKGKSKIIGDNKHPSPCCVHIIFVTLYDELLNYDVLFHESLK